MPAYDTMTIGELADVVAYLASLTTAEAPSCHAGAPGTAAIAMTSVPLADRPSPPPTVAHAFFAQSYDVLPGRLADFEAWFATRGRPALLASDGLLGIDTFVDAAKPGGALTTLFAFRDEAALRTFMGDPGTAEVWKEFDGFVGPHGHLATERPIVYRAEALSTP
jgi:hypothetical protein